MSRLIDSDQLEKRLNDLADLGIESMAQGLAAAIGLLHNAPAVEAAPVVHAKWIETRTKSKASSARGRIIVYSIVHCSNCKKSNGRIKKHRCPDCGAIMDLQD